MIRNQQVTGSSPVVGSKETPVGIESAGVLGFLGNLASVPFRIRKCCKMCPPFCAVAGKWRALALAFLGLPLLAQAREWTRTDTLLASVYVAAQVADWSQTRQICRYPGLNESNPALGDHPTAGAINRHFLKTTILDLAIAYLLKRTCPAWVSRAYLSANIGIEIDCIATNYRNGIRIRIGMQF